MGSAKTFDLYHRVVKGWDCIGYHEVITREGEIQHGRDRHFKGAHAFGKNSHSIGVCIIGNFHLYEPNCTQLLALQELYCSYCKIYSRELIIDFHRMAGKENSCPGNKLDRSDLLELLYRVSPYREL